MSEQNSPQPAPQPANWLEAFDRGDREGAQRLLNAENARDGIGQAAPGNNLPATPVDQPAPEAVNFVADDFRNSLGADGEALIAEWGGADSADFAANVGYMRHAVEHVSRNDPGLLQMLMDEFEDEAGNVSRFGDNPALIRAAAEYGRLLAHRDGTEVSAAQTTRAVKMDGNQPQQRTTTPAPRAPSASMEERIEELTSEMHNALSRGDRMKANRLDRELSRLSAAAYGDQPIVGRGGRYG